MSILLRSRDYRVRLQAAIFMMRDAESELRRIVAYHSSAEEYLKSELVKPRELRNEDRIWNTKMEITALSDGIEAMKGHIEGWQRYIDEGCPRDPKAQITPGAYKPYPIGV